MRQTNSETDLITKQTTYTTTARVVSTANRRGAACGDSSSHRCRLWGLHCPQRLPVGTPVSTGGLPVGT
eukprot:2422203-Pyramimonas_sp.AAC.1